MVNLDTEKYEPSAAECNWSGRKLMANNSSIVVKGYPGNRWKWSKQLFSKKTVKKIVPEPVPKQNL